MKKEINCEKCNDTAFRFYEVQEPQGIKLDEKSYRFELCTCVAARVYVDRIKKAAKSFVLFDFTA